MSIFSAIGKWFKGTTQEVIDVVDPVEMSACACGGQCTCGDSSQQETVSFATVTGEDSRVVEDVVTDIQEEIAAVVETVVEEAEKVAEVVSDVTEETTELTEEIIAAADKADYEMIEAIRQDNKEEVQLTLPLEQSLAQNPVEEAVQETPKATATVSKPKAKRVRKPKKSRAKRKK